MNYKYETAKALFSLISATMLKMLGENYKLIVLLLVTMVIDTIFGHLRAVKDRKWKSSNARWGVIGKLVELMLITLMYVCEWAFGIDWIVNAVIMYFICCEMASVAENIIRGHLNSNIPPEILDFFTKIKGNCLTGLKDWMHKFFGGDVS